MTTFLTIIFLLVCINAVMMFTSLYSVNRKSQKTDKGVQSTKSSKVYSIDLFDPNYKKAV